MRCRPHRHYKASVKWFSLLCRTCALIWTERGPKGHFCSSVVYHAALRNFDSELFQHEPAEPVPCVQLFQCPKFDSTSPTPRDINLTVMTRLHLLRHEMWRSWGIWCVCNWIACTRLLGFVCFSCTGSLSVPKPLGGRDKGSGMKPNKAALHLVRDKVTGAG